MTQNELADLVDRYSKPLIRYANSILKDVESSRDIVQECFLKVYPFSLKDLKIPGWLYREVRNRAIDFWRHRRHTQGLDSDSEENLMSEHPDPLTGLEIKEGVAMISERVKELSLREQEILRLKYGEGLSYEQIAEALGLTATNVGYILCQTLKGLRQSAGVSKEKSVRTYGQ